MNTLKHCENKMSVVGLSQPLVPTQMSSHPFPMLICLQFRFQCNSLRPPQLNFPFHQPLPFYRITSDLESKKPDMEQIPNEIICMIFDHGSVGMVLSCMEVSLKWKHLILVVSRYFDCHDKHSRAQEADAELRNILMQKYSTTDDLDKARLLLRLIKVNPPHDCLLYLAIKGGKRRFAGLILDKDCLNFYNESFPMTYIGSRTLGFRDIITKLVMHNSVRRKIGNLLYRIIAHGDGSVDTIRALTEQKNYKTYGLYKNRTLLHIAAYHGRLETCKFLVEKRNMNPNFADPWPGQTALHSAVQGGHPEVIEYLASLPIANVNCRDSLGCGPFHYAAKEGKLSVLRVLPSLPRVDVNLKSKFGQTMLHMAAAGGYAEAVKFLIALPKVDVHVKDLIGQTALDLLEGRGARFSQARHLLRRAMKETQVRTNIGTTRTNMSSIN